MMNNIFEHTLIMIHDLCVQQLGYDPAVRELMAWQMFNHQVSKDRITKMDIKGLVSIVFGDAANKELDGSDGTYKLVDIEHFKKWLVLNPTDERVYVPERHDCDDFADILMGDVTEWDSDLAFGTIWVYTGDGGHAVNWLVDTNNQIWLVEPQTDEVFRMPECWKWIKHIKM